MSEKSSTLAARVQAEKLVRDIRRAKGKHRSEKDKIRIIQKGRRDAIAKSLNDALSKKFSQTGGLRLGPVEIWDSQWGLFVIQALDGSLCID